MHYILPGSRLPGSTRKAQARFGLGKTGLIPPLVQGKAKTKPPKRFLLWKSPHAK